MIKGPPITHTEKRLSLMNSITQEGQYRLSILNLHTFKKELFKCIVFIL